ncbi:MAG TPA: MBL fold metallo-hydrolase [Dongiaceae bacterium]|jgi:glyoxylase-like metal-dependent hydrolase (beta-lactamase superfamily II)|nr:MBL fold metallo-hydrolase [Dongiaceae bacterium]
MGFQVADKWFEFRRVDDDITLIWEPHVVPLVRCNIWHVRGRDRDLLIDTGLGMASLKAAARHLFEKKLTAVATHAHYDHVGGFHEFEDRMIHGAEARKVAAGNAASLYGAGKEDALLESIRAAGYDVPPELFTSVPSAGYDPASYQVLPAPATRIVGEGDVVDTGDRRFEVLHLPGHSPGSIGLWEAKTGILFSGDAIYDGPLLDELPGSDIPIYVATMKRLRQLPVSVVHAGHDPSFGRARLQELCDAYLAKRA